MPEHLTRTLAALAARTAGGAGAELAGLGEWDRASVVLDVTAAGTEYGDTLNVYVQSSFDGATWYDVAAFEQVHGNEGAQRYLKRLSSVGGTPVPDAMPMKDGGLLAGTTFPCFSPDRLRVKWVIGDAGTDDAAFTFGAVVHLEYQG
jgi:hypothetical protein